MRTRLKLDTRVEYSDDVDTGPVRTKYLRTYDDYDRRRYLGGEWKHVERFLEASVGSVWDDVYSKLRTKYDHRSHVGYEVVRYIHSMIKTDWSRWHHSFYIDDDGILCQHIQPKYVKPIKPPERIHWYGDVWFERQTCNGSAKCGCVHFNQVKDKNNEYYYTSVEYVCIHGNAPVKRYLWYVVTYAIQPLDKVYRIVEYGSWDTVLSVYDNGMWRAKRPLEPEQKSFTMYYKDVPECNKPFVVSNKSVNRKEIKIIKGLGGIV
jgi:hypothetical protein